jgi:hypothetical protein
VPDDRALSLADFDRYVDEHGIPEEDWPAAFAQWIAEKTGGPVPRFEKVEESDVVRASGWRRSCPGASTGTDAGAGGLAGGRRARLGVP